MNKTIASFSTTVIGLLFAQALTPINLVVSAAPVNKTAPAAATPQLVAKQSNCYLVQERVNTIVVQRQVCDELMPANCRVTALTGNVGNPCVGLLPIRNLTADGSLQAYCRTVRINTIVVPEFCSILARAEKQFVQGNLPGAIQSYNEALRVNPQFAMAYYNRGISRYNMGDKTGAIADVSHANSLLKAQGDQPNYQLTLAMLNRLSQL